MICCPGIDRLFGISTAREAFKCCKKIMLTSEDDVSALDVIRFGDVISATVNTLNNSSHSLFCRKHTCFGIQNDQSIRSCAIVTVENGRPDLVTEDLAKKVKFFWNYCCISMEIGRRYRLFQLPCKQYMTNVFNIVYTAFWIRRRIV